MFLLPHILDWIYSDGFDKVTIPDEVPEAILNGVAVLESARESARTMGEWLEAITYIFLCN